MNLYDFIKDDTNVRACNKCPNKKNCRKEDVCLVEAHISTTNMGFILYNQSTYEEQRKLL